MNQTPQSNRLHIAIFGETNAGKSALFNAILGADMAIVSEVSGTTTDPVSRSMEFLPYGPIVLIDTAGANDQSLLGQNRMEKTLAVINRTDYALYAADPENFDPKEYALFTEKWKKKKVPHKLVWTKCDVRDHRLVTKCLNQYPDSYAISVYDHNTIAQLKSVVSKELEALSPDGQSLLGGLLPSGSTVILVVPVDSEAPKGRLILPQVQLIRDCLDHGICCVVTTPEDLGRALSQIAKTDLVVTDSQAFHIVKEIVPVDILLTSFSILMARQKGEIRALIEGVQAVRNLKDGDKVLISEVCVHNRTHEDIGRVKIPAMLSKVTGKNLTFDFTSGRDFNNPADYKLIVHCGGCMVTGTEMKNRIGHAVETGIPITNYGIAMAYGSGILERSIRVLEGELEGELEGGRNEI